MSSQIEARPKISNAQIFRRLKRPKSIRYNRLVRGSLKRLRGMWTASELPVWQGFSMSRIW